MTEEPRLKAKLWVQATIRTCGAQGITATIARRGDPDAGAVLIKQNLLGAGFRVLTQFRRPDGGAGWLAGTFVKARYLQYTDSTFTVSAAGKTLPGVDMGTWHLLFPCSHGTLSPPAFH